ncbi:MAG: hypothetical protein ACMG6E_09775 [Candidatus Roizmanbacteria bacterium]
MSAIPSPRQITIHRDIYSLFFIYPEQFDELTIELVEGFFIHLEPIEGFSTLNSPNSASVWALLGRPFSTI